MINSATVTKEIERAELPFYYANVLIYKCSAVYQKFKVVGFYGRDLYQCLRLTGKAHYSGEIYVILICLRMTFVQRLFTME